MRVQVPEIVPSLLRVPFKVRTFSVMVAKEVEIFIVKAPVSNPRLWPVTEKVAFCPVAEGKQDADVTKLKPMISSEDEAL